MKDIGSIVRSTLSKKFLGRQAIGAIAQNQFWRDFPEYKDNSTVYVRFSTIFITIPNPLDKINIHKKEKILINNINKRLEEIGYRQKISRIVFK